MGFIGKFDCELVGNIYRKFEYQDGGPIFEQVTIRELLDYCSQSELRNIRAVINGKLSKRTITPEQQAKMQEVRRRKKIELIWRLENE
jgi:hypothetical protein